MKHNILLFVCLLSFSSIVFGSNIRTINDTIYIRNEVRVFYKSTESVDSVHIFNKNFVLKERGYIVKNVIRFYDNHNQLSSIGEFSNNNFNGNFVYFKDRKLYKTVILKNGKENGIVMVYDNNGYLELIYQSIDGDQTGFSVLFDKHLPKYFRTDKMENEHAILGEFDTRGKLESISLVNNLSPEINAELEKSLLTK